MKFNEKPAYVEEGILGHGAFGEVHRVRLDDEVYALKRIYHYQLKNSEDHEAIQREISIMRKLSHPNIVKLYDVYETEHSIELLMQYVPGGTLYQKLKEYDRLPEYIAKPYIRDIIQALKYLHSFPEPILHRDVKPQNILLDDQNKAKLCDFGSANVIFPNNYRSSYVGTKQYMAPEMEESKPHNETLDVWSIGVLIHQLLTNRIPNEAIELPNFISRPAEDLIKRILIADPAKRMSLSQIQEHIWLYQENSRLFSRFSLKVTRESEEEVINRIKSKNKEISAKMKAKQPKVEIVSKRSTLRIRENTVNNYLENLKKISELQCSICVNEQKIERSICDAEWNQQFEAQYIAKMASNIQEYANKSIDLRQKQTNPQYSLYEMVRDLIGRLDKLKQHAVSIPRRYRQDILTFSDITVEDMTLPLSDYISKLKLQMLQVRRDALIDLKLMKKRQKQMPDFPSCEEDAYSTGVEASTDRLLEQQY